MTFIDFCSKCLKIATKCFYVLCLFTNIYGRLRPSRTSQTIDLEEINRLVSKFLNFIPYGFVSGRFFVSYKNFTASASKVYWKSIEILLKFYWNSIEILLKFYWNSIEILLKFYNSIEILLKFCRNSIEILSKFYWNSIEIL